MKRKNLSSAWWKSMGEGLLVIALGLWAGMLPAGAAQSATAATCEGRAASGAVSRIDIEDSAVILVATPQFQDPRWQKTVLLAAPLPNGGHVGVIINRPTELTLGTLFPEHEASQKVRDPVFFGGPFFVNVLVAVARSDAPLAPGHFPLAHGLILATGEGAVDAVIERDGDQARYFVGLVAWRPGELDIELANKLWSVCQANAETVFRADVKRLWNELSATTRRTRVSIPLPTGPLAQSMLR